MTLGPFSWERLLLHKRSFKGLGTNGDSLEAMLQGVLMLRKKKKRGCSQVHSGQPLADSGVAIQPAVGQLQGLQEPLQDVQDHGPLGEDQRPAALRLHLKMSSQSHIKHDIDRIDARHCLVPACAVILSQT